LDRGGGAVRRRRRPPARHPNRRAVSTRGGGAPRRRLAPYAALGTTFAVLLVVQRHAPFFPELSTTVIEDLADGTAALRVAGHILSVIGQPLTFGDLDLLPRASVGIAISGGAIETSETLFGAADRALYLAKDQGRGRVCLHEDLQSDTSEDLALVRP